MSRVLTTSPRPETVMPQQVYVLMSVEPGLLQDVNLLFCRTGLSRRGHCLLFDAVVTAVVVVT